MSKPDDHNEHTPLLEICQSGCLNFWTDADWTPENRPQKALESIDRAIALLQERRAWLIAIRDNHGVVHGVRNPGMVQ